MRLFKRFFICCAIALAVLLVVVVVWRVVSPRTFSKVIRAGRRTYREVFHDRLKGVPYSNRYDGIDVSKHNGVIRWENVAKNGKVQFVYVKATEGKSVVDRRYRRNVEGARKAGVKVGAYHFLSSKSSATHQFFHFLEVAKPDEQDLIPVLDVEEGGIRGRWQGKELQDSVEVFARLVKKYYGKLPVIYSNEHFYNKHLAPRLNRYLLFIANYKSEPSIVGGGKVNIWQRSQRGHLPGIGEYVDLNLLQNGTDVNPLLLR